MKSTAVGTNDYVILAQQKNPDTPNLVSLELTTQTPLNFQFRVHGAVGEGSIPEACLANPTASQLSFEKNRNSVPCTCETRIVKGLFAVHKQYGSVLPQRTTSVSTAASLRSVTLDTWHLELA